MLTTRQFPRPSTPLRSTPMHQPMAHIVAPAVPVAPTAPVATGPTYDDAPWWDRLDAAAAAFFARCGVPLLRVSLGIVFFWFGALKIFPGTSPAEELAGRTIAVLTHDLLQPQFSVPLLGLWEFAIGVGLLTGKSLRLTLLLLFAQMLGTITPLIFFPAETFSLQPFVPTLEGQYIIKNLVLISAAMVLGATTRGGRMVSEPPARRT